MIIIEMDWEISLGLFLSAYEHGTHQGRQAALKELQRMAKLADLGNKAVKQCQSMEFLIQEAMDQHIYDADKGEVPEPDCAYLQAVEDCHTIIVQAKELSNGRVQWER